MAIGRAEPQAAEKPANPPAGQVPESWTGQKAASKDSAPVQAPASPATLSGRVVDAEGRPAAGVEVLLSGACRTRFERPMLARATSGQDGQFRIEIPAETDSRKANYPLAVWAYDPKMGLAWQSFTRSAPPAAGTVCLKLGGPVHVAIRVVRPDGKPVAGGVRARRRLCPDGKPVVGEARLKSSCSLPDSLAARLRATTDADGKGQILGCRAEDIEAVQVEAAGFGLQGSELGAEAGGVRTIALRAAGRVIGRVQADNPAAARGLDVIALTLPQGSAGPQTTGQGSATIDAEGRFEIPAIAAGKLHVGVLPAKGTKLRPKPPTGLALEAGKTAEVTIPMEGPPRERTVTGRVVDRTGQPIAGAVVFQSGDSEARTEATTGVDGRFALSGVVARPTFLFVRKPGYRFLGLAIAARSNDVTLKIHKVQERPRLLRRTLPPPLPRQEERTLARHLLDPYAERALKQGGQPEKVRTLEALRGSSPSACWS